MKISIAVKSLLGAASLALPLFALAESNVQTGAATSSPGATAHVDFQVVIPKILYLRVGTGSSYTTGALTSTPTIDLITFSPTSAQLGSGTAIAGTGGDLSGGVETAAVVSNSGNVTLNATAAGALSRRHGRYDFVLADHHHRLDAHLGNCAARAGADQFHERERGAHGARDQSDHPGRQVDFRVTRTARSCRPVRTVA